MQILHGDWCLDAVIVLSVCVSDSGAYMHISTFECNCIMCVHVCVYTCVCVCLFLFMCMCFLVFFGFVCVCVFVCVFLVFVCVNTCAMYSQSLFLKFCEHLHMVEIRMWHTHT